VYVTPSHQFPTGVSLSMPRRMQLLAWARDNRVLILEDDYDSEFRYNTRPLPSLQGMTPDSPVLYIGTFSKLLLPTLRIGYLVLPHPLRDAFVSAKLLSDIQSSALDQRILADFLNEGHLEPYVRQMRTVYGKRRALFVRSLRKLFGSHIRILGDDAGMHFMAEFKTPLPEEEAYRAAFEAGVRLEKVYWPAGKVSIRPGHAAFVLAFAGRSDAEICLAAERLAGAIL
jgi:GntR family transcriptional regulator/MocR family aminotransferase